jgi:hypothetical protein
MTNLRTDEWRPDVVPRGALILLQVIENKAADTRAQVQGLEVLLMTGSHERGSPARRRSAAIASHVFAWTPTATAGRLIDGGVPMNRPEVIWTDGDH